MKANQLQTMPATGAADDIPSPSADSPPVTPQVSEDAAQFSGILNKASKRPAERPKDSDTPPPQTSDPEPSSMPAMPSVAHFEKQLTDKQAATPEVAHKEGASPQAVDTKAKRETHDELADAATDARGEEPAAPELASATPRRAQGTAHKAAQKESTSREAGRADAKRDTHDETETVDTATPAQAATPFVPTPLQQMPPAPTAHGSKRPLLTRPRSGRVPARQAHPIPNDAAAPRALQVTVAASQPSKPKEAKGIPQSSSASTQPETPISSAPPAPEFEQIAPAKRSAANANTAPVSPSQSATVEIARDVPEAMPDVPPAVPFDLPRVEAGRAQNRDQKLNVDADCAESSGDMPAPQREATHERVVHERVAQEMGAQIMAQQVHLTMVNTTPAESPLVEILKEL